MATDLVGGASSYRFRTVFVSDVHLGCRYTRAEEFLAFLEEIEVERIYLVGDFIDGWRLKRHWRWSPIYVRILQRLVQMAMQGTCLYYTPGNHDEFLRDYLHDFGFVVVSDQFVHRTADGRRFIVVHGDKFEGVKSPAKWLATIGGYAYDCLVSVNGLVNGVRGRLRLNDWRFSSRVKTWARQAVQFVSNFEDGLACHAKELDCQGVICGHVHVPRLKNHDGIVYCNTGDWVEHCSVLVEYETGELELVEWLQGQTRLLSREPDLQCDAKPSACESCTTHLAASVPFQLPEIIKL